MSRVYPTPSLSTRLFAQLQSRYIHNQTAIQEAQRERAQLKYKQQTPLQITMRALYLIVLLLLVSLAVVEGDG